LARHNYIVTILQTYSDTNVVREAILNTARISRRNTDSTAPSLINSTSSSSSTSLRSSIQNRRDRNRLTRDNIIADLYVPNHKLAIDVSVVATRERDESHYQAEQRADLAKRRKYLPALNNNAIASIIPFIVGPFGNLGTSATQYINETAKKENIAEIRSRIAIAAARGTARMILCWSRLYESVQV